MKQAKIFVVVFGFPPDFLLILPKKFVSYNVLKNASFKVRINERTINLIVLIIYLLLFVQNNVNFI